MNMKLTPQPLKPRTLDTDVPLQAAPQPRMKTVPSDWNIEATETGITARNGAEYFEGSMEDFNKMLRGE